MQTFLPFPDMQSSVRCLDNKRLGKQRVECLQILRTLNGQSHGWKHHPAVKQWVGYEDALKCYMNLCIDEWKKRGFKNTIKKQKPKTTKLPWWLGCAEYHLSHQSNLLRKDRAWYGQFFNGSDTLPYVWPSSQPPITEHKKT